MQKTDPNQMAKNPRRRVQSSTTLSRKYVKRPTTSSDVSVSIKRSSKISRFTPQEQSSPSMSMGQRIVTNIQDEQIEQAQMHPLQMQANARMRQRSETQKQPEVKKMSAKELKDQAIKKALASASKTTKETQEKKIRTTTFGGVGKMHFSLGRVVLALACTAVAVFAIVYYVNLNMPDLSLRVAAMQTGIEATYPNYIPRDFNLSDITSENGKITLNFNNASTGDSFTLIEEKSSWDSNALLNNFVKEAYGEDYSVVREQGLTIYMTDTDASWVNGGVFYKIHVTSGSLTKKQIRSIAVSM